MVLRITHFPDGRVVFACGRPGPPKPCDTCGRTAAFLCDFPLSEVPARTCDAALCPHCRTRVAPETDYCPPHAALLPEGRG